MSYELTCVVCRNKVKQIDLNDHHLLCSGPPSSLAESNIRRPNHVTIRLSDQEKENYQSAAEKKGWSVSELMRRAADEMTKEIEEG